MEEIEEREIVRTHMQPKGLVQIVYLIFQWKGRRKKLRESWRKSTAMKKISS
jgi:hypothetical protein